MKIVCAIDSMKGSMTSMEAGNAAKEGILKAMPDAEVIVKPLADGGEGTTDALIEGLGGKKVELTVTGPLGEKVPAYYGILPDKQLAIMEMAAAAGIILVERDRKNPMKATTYGVGEMIKDAVKKGCREFIIGIGGSATNDGGVGMLQALGYQFYDAQGRELGFGAEVLGRIHEIKSDAVMPELKECHFKIACDVKNPLCGENGATYVFGKQKGVREEERETIDAAMASYAKTAAGFLGKDVSEAEGCGAAGGMGFAFLAFLDAELVPGIELILDAIEIERDMQDSDIVITGEGMLDFQTAMGKVPVGVAKMAKKYHNKVIAFAGGVTKEAAACNEAGIDAFFPIVRGVCTLEEALVNENARNNITDAAEQVFRLIKLWN